MDQVKIGKFIAQCRNEKNITQEELGEKLGVTNKTISRWENGHYLPDIEMMQLLSKEFSISINELISGEKINDLDYKEKAEEIFKCIPMKMELFYDKFAKECNTVPIFKYYDPFQMFQRISCASNEDIVTIREMLAERAKHHKQEIESEMPNIAKLKRIMDDYTDGKRPTIKTVMIEEFSKELEKILNSYKKENNKE